MFVCDDDMHRYYVTGMRMRAIQNTTKPLQFKLLEGFVINASMELQNKLHMSAQLAHLSLPRGSHQRFSGHPQASSVQALFDWHVGH